VAQSSVVLFLVAGTIDARPDGDFGVDLSRRRCSLVCWSLKGLAPSGSTYRPDKSL
jgi:hypothetical protein